MKRFEYFDSVMVTKLNPYLLDLGFKPGKSYSVRRVRLDGVEGLGVASDEGNQVRLSDIDGEKLTGAGHCFDHFRPREKRKKKEAVSDPNIVTLNYGAITSWQIVPTGEMRTFQVED